MNDTIETAQKPTMDNPQSPPACSTSQVGETGPSQFEVYADYNRMLRTWFVVFGVGSIAGLIGSKDLVGGLRSAGALRCVVMLLAFGAGAQIILAFINKNRCLVPVLRRVQSNFPKWQNMQSGCRHFFLLHN